MDTRTVEKLGRSFRVHEGQHDWMWEGLSNGNWEHDTFTAFSELIPNAELYVDIGAWIGPTVLFGATIAPRVVAVEPDAVAMSQLIGNLSLNTELLQKTELFDLAIAESTGPVELFSNSFGNSMTSRVAERGVYKITLMAMDIDEFFDKILRGEKKIFVKVDIEGSEYEVIPRLCKSLERRGVSADLHVSLHGDFFFDQRQPFLSWSKNIFRHGSIMKSMSEFGTVHRWSSGTWIQINDIADDESFSQQLIKIGGISSTLLVKRKNISVVDDVG